MPSLGAADAINRPRTPLAPPSPRSCSTATPRPLHRNPHRQLPRRTRSRSSPASDAPQPAGRQPRRCSSRPRRHHNAASFGGRRTADRPGGRAARGWLLDVRLFDIAGADPAGLRRPVVAADRQLPARRGAAPRDGRRHRARTLASVRGVAVQVSSGEFGADQRPAGGDDLARRQVALLDQSNAQVGVPIAWLAGYTGQGVTVAVLDTGYDADHPDLTDVAGPRTSPAPARRTTSTATARTSRRSRRVGRRLHGKYKGVAPEPISGARF